ncbi:MAG: carbohydate-binding domain-containing protein [Gammaproteobacteria bacterium]|nr:carbohydate-binding domain-containing protein [Gammaproteobacteria bacterium]
MNNKAMNVARYLWILCFLMMGLTACQSPLVESTTSEKSFKKFNQQQLDRMAAGLKIQYHLLDNEGDSACKKDTGSANCFTAELTLTASETITDTEWGLYFSHMWPIARVYSDEFIAKHINGNLYSLNPTNLFQGLKAGVATKLIVRGRGSMVSETDLFPNYYIAAPGLKARNVASTRLEQNPNTGLEERPFVVPYAEQAQVFQRFAKEKTERATPSAIFAANKHYFQGIDKLDNSEDTAFLILPTPQSVKREKNGGFIDISAGLHFTKIDLSDASTSVIVKRLELLEIANTANGVPIEARFATNWPKKPGSYRLDINDSAIEIVAGDQAGLFYGLQSLVSLVVPGSFRLPLITVEDEPRYPFRGMHLDVARNFHSKDYVITLLEQMAAYKLNKLHFHLADDEAWRLEIAAVPELTKIGSKRCHDPAELRCLLPSFGSGIDIDSPISGYYSQADYQEILQQAAMRHIEVIPSFDMPGHSRAAVKAMEARYYALTAQGRDVEALRYLLSDPNDETSYRSIQGYKDNTINVCMESAFTFIEAVIDSVASLHNAAGYPLQTYHIGGDETPGAWVDSPLCQKFLADNDAGVSDVTELGGYFLGRVANTLAARGIKPAAWGDGLEHVNGKTLTNGIQSNIWLPLKSGIYKEAHRQANQGWSVVLSIPDVVYFDFPYEADPKEPGFYWGSRATNTRKVFEFMPDNLPAHAEFWLDDQGLPFESDDRSKAADGNTPGHLPLAPGVGFQGIQGQLWSEVVQSPQRADYQLFPRLLALAERAWHRAEWELPYRHEGVRYGSDTAWFNSSYQQRRAHGWLSFVAALGKELPKLDMAGVRYRIPTVGSKRVNDTLYANVIFPSLAIEYRIGNQAWQVYTGPMPVPTNMDIELRAISADGKRKGRTLISSAQAN